MVLRNIPQTGRICRFVNAWPRGVAKGLYPAGWIGGNEEPLETGERR